MYAQVAIKPNPLLRNGAYGIVMRGVQKCTRGCSSLRGRNKLPLCCIKLDTATDLGCGTGEMMKLILQQNEDKSLYGIDLSEKMLDVAKEKLGNRVKLILGDSEQLPFPDSFFDVVYCNDSFHHYPAPDKVLSEISRVLKPKGVFLMCDCWQPAIGRAIMNFYMKHSKEGDVKIYSEHEIRELFSAYFSKILWERIGNTSCMACGIK